MISKSPELQPLEQIKEQAPCAWLNYGVIPSNRWPENRFGAPFSTSGISGDRLVHLQDRCGGIVTSRTKPKLVGLRKKKRTGYFSSGMRGRDVV